MIFIRSLLCIPVAAIIAATLGITWFTIFNRASYAEDSIFISIVGLLPSVMGRALAVCVFVTLATYISPNPNRITLSAFSIIGGTLGWPFGPKYEIAYSSLVFYTAEAVGVLFGVACGVMLGFVIIRKRRNEKIQTEPNK